MTRDLAILDDGREVPVADFGYGELLVLCMRGRIRCIRHAQRASRRAPNPQPQAPKRAGRIP